MEKKLNDRFMVIGLGSPIMTDDAIGLRVVQAISDMHLGQIDTLQEAVGGLEILPMIRGYGNVVIVDAIQTYQQKPGTVMIYDPDDFDDTIGNTFAHDINLATALKIGKQMDPYTMPDKVMFIAIEVQDIQTMSETMTPEVEASVGPAINAVLYLIDQLKFQRGLDRTS